MSPEQAFWAWFQEHQDRLYDFEKDQEPTFDALQDALQHVDSYLTFEFGPIEDGKREFTISADGIREAFPKVEALYKAAPPLPRWKIQKFRQRHDPTDVEIGDSRIMYESLLFVMDVRDSKADITVFIPGYIEADREKYMSFVFLFLDQVLGEFDVETRVGGIEAKALTSAPETAKAFAELAEEFDTRVPRIN
jgi:hypothetical protein